MEMETMSEHCVRLPHPDPQELTVGSCPCGWTVTYRDREQELAVNAALIHIQEYSQSHVATVTRTPREDR